MFQVIYEYTETWPEKGALTLEVPPIIGKIQVSPDLAKRRAKGYLTCEVGMAFRPGEPMFVWGERPLWRMPIHLHLRGYGQVATFGLIAVDATTREVIPLPVEQIMMIQDRADELATRLTSPTEPAGRLSSSLRSDGIELL